MKQQCYNKGKFYLKGLKACIGMQLCREQCDYENKGIKNFYQAELLKAIKD